MAHIRAQRKRRSRVEHRALREADRLARGPAVHQEGLRLDEPPERHVVGRPDALAVERGELRRLRGIGARGRRPVHVGHGHAEPLEIGGEALEPDIDHARPALEDLTRRGHVASVRSARITRSGPAMHAAARAAWALDGSTQAPARSSRAI